MDQNFSTLRVVEDRIDEYEKWFVEHKMAQACFEFEEHLCGFVELYRMIESYDKLWRAAVFANCGTFSPELESVIKSVYEKWLSIQPETDHLLAVFEQQNYEGGVKGAKAYREFVEKAKTVLEDWTTPTVSPALAHHLVKLNAEQSRKFRELIG